jgi:ATP-dependent RNA helicase RhlE
MSFAALGLCSELVRAVSERNYPTPTSIQSAAIPAILRNEDVFASADTGSGKTAAFALPILQKLTQTKTRTRALVLAPTRELAAQIGESFKSYARYFPQRIKIVTTFGGVSINPQMMALRGGADIVVGTPGRLLDLINQNALRLNDMSVLVLDEADKLLDLGFADELRSILDLLPQQRQNLFFSATLPAPVRALADRILNNPTRIEIEASQIDRPAIKQRAIEVDVSRRTPLLRHLLQTEQWSRVLVFVATKYSAEHIADKLQRAGIKAAPFHGELSQGTRTQTLVDFKASTIQVLVATDVAARGIDIAELPVVINYDLPRSATDYVHRIGRTGRAGKFGVAISFISADTEAHFRLIEKRNHLTISRERIDAFEPTETIAVNNESSPSKTATAAQTSTGGIKGKRKSKKDKLREAALAGQRKSDSR